MNDYDIHDVTPTTETTEARIARLNLTDIGEARMRLLERANAANVSDAVFAQISDALRASSQATIVLPAHRFENLSRGRGWARQGKGDSAVWGERADKGYRVGAGKWTVGGNDGYFRKGEDTWVVSHVTVGTETWTVAV